MNLSHNLKKIRKDNNLSQEQLAEQLGVSRQSVSKWESGQAYPEMDKMLQLCQLFNLNIDDLLNQDINELNNNKQAKNNINKFIDDFLDYITKTIDMFSAMKFKDKVKCIFEQFIIILTIMIAFLIIGTFGSNVLQNLLSFLKGDIYYAIYNVFEAIYITMALILGTILVLHIFKTRYLDYCVVVKEKIEVINNELKENNNEENEKEEVNYIYVEKPNQKIIIRDPEHSGYKFISGLLKCFLLIMKSIIAFIAILFCLSFVGFIICLIISFAFIKTGLLFIGMLLLILSLIVINLIALRGMYNFIISKKTKKNKLAITFIISLFVLGSGFGFISLGATNFDIIDDINSEYFISQEETIKMTNDLFFENYYGNINYIESDNKDIKIVYKHSKYYNIKRVEISNSGYYFYYDITYTNITEIVRTCIQDINNKRIVNYSNYEIDIYTTKENIEILKNNLVNHRNNEEKNSRQEMINEYENAINELELELERKNDEIEKLAKNCLIET